MVLNLVLLGQKKTIGCCGLNITINNMYHLGVIDSNFFASKVPNLTYKKLLYEFIFS
jgi:hypothetical protein